jgi:hypothetical protein
MMRELASALGVTEDLQRLGLPALDFETAFSSLVTNQLDRQLQADLERRVDEYFGRLRLPQQPTFYDYLVLSLRGKDLIATFNWDPLLFQAFQRNLIVGEENLPRIAYLHGSAAFSLCMDHKRYVPRGRDCGQCGHPPAPMQLLYPVAAKDYQSSPFIREQWQMVAFYLRRASFLSTMGYSAPRTDVEARHLLRQPWQENETFQLNEMEIIDVRPAVEIEETWKDFPFSHHYRILDDVWKSEVLRVARRSTEALFDRTMMLKPWEGRPLPRASSLAKLQDSVRPLIDEELRVKRGEQKEWARSIS